MICKIQKWTEFWTKIYIIQRSQCSNSTTEDQEWNSSHFAPQLCSKIQSFRVAPWGWENSSEIHHDCVMISMVMKQRIYHLHQLLVIEGAAIFNAFLILVFSVFSGGLLVVVNKQWENSLWHRQDLCFRSLGMYSATYKQLVPNKQPKFYCGSPNSIQKRQILMNLVSCWAKHAQVNLHKWWHITSTLCSLVAAKKEAEVICCCNLCLAYWVKSSFSQASTDLGLKHEIYNSSSSEELSSLSVQNSE